MVGRHTLNFLYSTTHFTLSLQNMLDINLWRCTHAKTIHWTLLVLLLLIDFQLNASENLEPGLYIKKTLGYQKGFGFLFMRGSCKQTKNPMNKPIHVHAQKTISLGLVLVCICILDGWCIIPLHSYFTIISPVIHFMWNGVLCGLCWFDKRGHT